MAIDPEAQESFVAMLRRSGLIEKARLNQVLEDFAHSESHPFGDTVTSLTMVLIASGLLTNWQVAKLREGKHKGFFIDDLLLLDFLKTSTEFSTYLARDQKRNLLCKVRIFPPKSPWVPSVSIEYEVEDL